MPRCIGGHWCAWGLRVRRCHAAEGGSMNRPYRGHARRLASGEPAARDEFLAAEEAEEDFVLRPGVLGVVFEAVALEILDGVSLAVGRADFGEFFGGREAID